MHEKYNQYVHDYDYALIQLNESLKFDANKQPIKLHEFGEEIPVGTIIQQTGWSFNKDDSILALRRGTSFVNVI